MRTRIVALLTGLALGLGASAQDLPAGVLEAEMAQDWPQASSLLRYALGQQPERRDWWQRLAQTEAASGRRDAAANALLRAAQSGEPDAELFAHASAALAYANRPEDALAALDKARQLNPDHPDYAMREVLLANWLGDTPRARSLLHRLWTRAVQIPGLGYQYAQALSWDGQTDAARAVLLEYLRDQPQEAPAMLLLARLESWRGDYAQSVHWLDRYLQSGGDQAMYQAEKAAVLAWADRPHDAINLLTQMPDESEHQVRRIYAEAVAYRKLNRNAAVSSRLRELRGARTDGVVDPEGLETYLTTSLRDNIDIDNQYSSDSDGIGIWNSQLRGRWWPAAPLLLEAYVGSRRVNLSERPSALAADAPVAAITSTHLGLGANWFPSGHWQIRLAGGLSRLDDPESDRFETGELALAFRPDDAFRVRLSADRKAHAVSPRAADRAIIRDEFALALDWQPSLRWDMKLRLARADFSSASECGACQDDNQREQLQLSAFRRILFRQDWNLSAGLRVILTRFEQDLDNGYYDPRRFDNIALVSNLYYAFNPEQGFALTVALGGQRDLDLDPHFTPAADLAASLSLGIWSDTLVQLRLAGSYGVSRVGDDYSALSAGLSITQRF